MQTPRQQHRHGHLVELQPRPIGGSINPAVLRKSAVRPLNRRQPDQSAQRRACLTGGEQCCGAVHEVSRPHQVITAQILVAFGFAPGDTHRGDHSALKNFVFVRQQHTSTQSIHSTGVAGIAAKVEFGIDDGALPLTNIPVALCLERFG